MNGFDCDIYDEGNLSSRYKDPSYISAEYNNQNDPAAFWVTGAWEEQDVGGSVETILGHATVSDILTSATFAETSSSNGSALVTSQAIGNTNDIDPTSGQAILAGIVAEQILTQLITATALLPAIIAIGDVNSTSNVVGQASVLDVVATAISNAIVSSNGSALVTSQAIGNANDIDSASGQAVLAGIVPGQILTPTITATALLSHINALGNVNSIDKASGTALTSNIQTFSASVTIELTHGSGVLLPIKGVTKLQIDFDNITINLGAHIIQALPSNHIINVLPSNHIIH